MWKWTDDHNIKGIIIDVDSLNDENINNMFKQIIPDMKIFEVSRQNRKLLNTHHIAIQYVDVMELLYGILSTYDMDSTQLISISCDYWFINEMIKYHIGTLSCMKYELDKMYGVPDFLTNNLEKVLSGRLGGYCAEQIVSNNPKSTTRLLDCKTTLFLDNGVEKNLNLYFGGRYFPANRNYFLDDALSVVIRMFKRKYNPFVDQYYDQVIGHLAQNESIDYVTYVPLKPNDIKEKKFDRFANLNLSKCKEIGLLYQPLLKCTKDFTQKQDNYYGRSTNVKDAFMVTEDVKNKTIVVIDDLYTTGTTIREIARTLYQNGAKKVIAVFMGINQKSESTTLKYKHLKCPRCGNDMWLFVNGTNGTLFFGCRNRDITISYNEGIHQLKKANVFDVEDILDLEDIY